MPKPIPVPDEVSKPFWDACNEHRLVVQNCLSCNRLQFPPEKVCANCGSLEALEWKEVSGKGKILDYFVIHDSRIRPIREDQPINVAVITLEENPEINFLSNLPGIPVDEVPVGARVEVYFEPVGPGQLIHEWRVIG